MTSRNWVRVSRRHPCPVCGHPDWCLVSADGSSIICPRVESTWRVGEAGWLHRLRDDPWQPERLRVRTVRIGAAAPRSDLADLAARYRGAVTPGRLQRLAACLGLTAASLGRLGVGWSAEHRAWSFPMTDPAGAVLGIRLRRPDGFKFAVKGSKEGLFLPPAGEGSHGLLLVCEGPTDATALLDLGFANVAGRPSCMGGIKLVVELVRRRQPPEVVILADGDEPGRRGVGDLAAVLLAYAASVRVITPPEGVKDARAWVQGGGTGADVEQAIAAAPARRLVVRRAEKKG